MSIQLIGELPGGPWRLARYGGKITCVCDGQQTRVVHMDDMPPRMEILRPDRVPSTVLAPAKPKSPWSFVPKVEG